MSRLLCWLGRHPEIRCSHVGDGCGGEYVSGDCIACRRHFFWWRRNPWGPLGSTRKALVR